ncbi:hypothetical protein [Lacticaseibacillus saniviri]
MLIDKKAFDTVTGALKEQGVIRDFEAQNGKITGHMMITIGEIPEDLTVKLDPNRKSYIFIGSFDFYDATVGLAIYLDKFEIASGVWSTPQVVNAESPTREWIEFFIRILVGNIDADGGFGVPMYTYISDSADFTVVPGRP